MKQPGALSAGAADIQQPTAPTHTYDEGFWNMAAAVVDAAIAMEPDNRDAWQARFDLLFEFGCYDAALDAANTLLALDARDALAHCRRAWALLKLERFDEGLAAADRALCLDPDSISGHLVRGALLVELDRLGESLAAFDDALRCGAPDTSVFFERGRAKLLLGDAGEALAEFDRAIASDPEDAQAHVTRGLVKFGGGDWRAGFADLEWRLKLPGHVHHDLMKRAPRWQGESLAGKRLLVCCEWDHGDAFHFVRYLRLIENSGAAITLAVPEASVRLLAANFPGVAVIGSAGVGTRGDFDFHASLMSLPAARCCSPTSPTSTSVCRRT